jgi:hypothetical protein
MSLEKNLAALIDQFLTVAVRICGPRVVRLTLSTERTGPPWEFGARSSEEKFTVRKLHFGTRLTRNLPDRMMIGCEQKIHRRYHE